MKKLNNFQILSPDKPESLLNKERNQKIVLVGGCFDVVHLGHVIFLEKAKKLGDKLVVLLENDKNISENKGKNRPINNQKNRAILLSKFRMVDEVIKLPYMSNDDDYWKIIKKIKPDIIAVTKGDKNLSKKIVQARKIEAKLVEVTKKIPNQSTSRILELFKL